MEVALRARRARRLAAGEEEEAKSTWVDAAGAGRAPDAAARSVRIIIRGVDMVGERDKRKLIKIHSLMEDRGFVGDGTL